MNDINKVIVEGNLTRTPELKQISEKARVTTFGIANHRYWPESRDENGEPASWKSKTSFLEVEAWNFQADKSFNELKVGDRVELACRVEQDQWLNDEGAPRSKTKLVLQHFEKKEKGHLVEDAQADEAPEADRA